MSIYSTMISTSMHGTHKISNLHYHSFLISFGASHLDCLPESFSKIPRCQQTMCRIIAPFKIPFIPKLGIIVVKKIIVANVFLKRHNTCRCCTTWCLRLQWDLDFNMSFAIIDQLVSAVQCICKRCVHFLVISPWLFPTSFSRM